MKQLFFCAIWIIAFSTTVWAQSSPKDSASSKKVVLTLQRQGQSRDLSVVNYNFSFEKMFTDTVNGHAIRGILMVGLEKYTPFLLQAVGGDSTNMVSVKVVVYDSTGQKESSIQMNHAFVRSTSVSHIKNYGADISVGFAAPDIVVDDVKL